MAGAIPLVALLHETTGFDGMLAALAAIAGMIFLCVLALPRASAMTVPVPSAAS